MFECVRNNFFVFLGNRGSRVYFGGKCDVGLANLEVVDVHLDDFLSLHFVLPGLQPKLFLLSLLFGAKSLALLLDYNALGVVNLFRLTLELLLQQDLLPELVKVIVPLHLEPVCELGIRLKPFEIVAL